MLRKETGLSRLKGTWKAMGDVFIERMVKKKFEGKDALVLVGIVVGIALCILIALYVGLVLIRFPALGLLAAVGAGYGGYKLMSMRLLEYEYSLTNGYITVDKIMNRSSRKRLTSFECSSCEEIGEYAKSVERLRSRTFDNRVFAAEYADFRNSWYMVVNGTKTGRTLVVFDPDEDLQEAIKKFIPRSLRFEVFGRS